MLFPFLFLFTALQRIVELRLAKRNTQKLLQNGAVEFGRGHYWVLVVLHSAFFLCLFTEKYLNSPETPAWWPALFTIFFLAQLARVWVIRSLGGRWTTRIIVLPGKATLKQGPFRFLPHPNYTVVAVELAVLPAIFGLYWTAALFSLLNALVLLLLRIPEENRALRWAALQNAPGPG